MSKHNNHSSFPLRSPNHSLILESLPEELWLTIISFVDYHSLCALEKTCCFFRKELLNRDGFMKLLINNLVVVVNNYSSSQHVNNEKSGFQHVFDDDELYEQEEDYVFQNNFVFDSHCHEETADLVIQEIKHGHRQRSTQILREYFFEKIMKEDYREIEREYMMNYLVLEEFKFQSLRDVYIACHLFNVNPFVSWRKILPTKKNNEQYNAILMENAEELCGLRVHWKGIVIQNSNGMLTCYLYDDDEDVTDLFNIELSALPIIILKHVKNLSDFKYLDTVEFIAEIESMPDHVTSNRNFLGFIQGAHSVLDQFSSSISQYIPHYNAIDTLLKSNLYVTLRVQGDGTLIRQVANNNLENINLTVTRFTKEANAQENHGQVIRWNAQIIWKFIFGTHRYLLVRCVDPQSALLCLVKCEKQISTNSLPSPGDTVSIKASIIGNRLLNLKKVHEVLTHESVDEKKRNTSTTSFHHQLFSNSILQTSESTLIWKVLRIILKVCWWLYLVFAWIIGTCTGFTLY
nr:unnamed protein product [Naegleria fowleri]